MSDKIKIAIVVVVAAIVFVLANSLYIVEQTEQAIVLQFGEPVRVVKEAGLKAKIPFIQKVVFYDNRLLNLDSLQNCRPLAFLQNRSHRISGPFKA